MLLIERKLKRNNNFYSVHVRSGSATRRRKALWYRIVPLFCSPCTAHVNHSLFRIWFWFCKDIRYTECKTGPSQNSNYTWDARQRRVRTPNTWSARQGRVRTPNTWSARQHRVRIPNTWSARQRRVRIPNTWSVGQRRVRIPNTQRARQCRAQTPTMWNARQRRFRAPNTRSARQTDSKL